MQVHKQGIEKFLSLTDTRFIIPIYQRSYNWGKTHWDQLFKDILAVGDNHETDDYFIGSIVYICDHGVSSSIDKFVIVDGQQRLTTLMLIYLVLYRRAQESKNETLASKIYKQCLTNEFSQGEEKIKLKPIEGDNTALKYLLDGKDSQKYSEHSSIIDAFDYFYGHITHENVQSVQNGLKKLMFVEIKLERGHDDPQKIFESLNSTGLELSQADLIRNYILMGRKPEEQEELYRKYWTVIETHARDEYLHNGKIGVSAFIRDYLTLKNKEIPNQGKVYSEFKEKYPPHTFEKLKKDLEEMVTLVKIYHKLVNPTPKNEPNPHVQTELQYMRTLDMGVAHPFLMKVYDDYANKGTIDEITFIAILKLIQSFVFRRVIVGVSTNALNRIFMVLYEKVDADNYLHSIQKALLKGGSSARFPSDTEVRHALEKKDIYSMKSKNSKYFFDRLENHENKEPVKSDNLTIEHIFPQNPDSAWKKALEDDEYKRIKEEYLHTIGNLTLSGNNGALGNKSFQEKRDLQDNGYKSSRLWLNNDLGKLDHWNQEAIVERCERLTDRFLKIWERPDIPIDPAEEENEVNISDADDLTGKIDYIIFMGETITVEIKRDIYREILTRLFDLQTESFFSPKMNEKIKLTKNKEDWRTPLQISDTYYTEGNLTNNQMFTRIKHALSIFELEDELSVNFRKE